MPSLLSLDFEIGSCRHALAVDSLVLKLLVTIAALQAKFVWSGVRFACFFAALFPILL